MNRRKDLWQKTITLIIEQITCDVFIRKKPELFDLK